MAWLRHEWMPYFWLCLSSSYIKVWSKPVANDKQSLCNFWNKPEPNVIFGNGKLKERVFVALLHIAEESGCVRVCLYFGACVDCALQGYLCTFVGRWAKTEGEEECCGYLAVCHSANVALSFAHRRTLDCGAVTPAVSMQKAFISRIKQSTDSIHMWLTDRRLSSRIL